MVCGERGAHTGKPAAQAGRFLYRDAVTPSEDVPAHFVEAAGLETDCQRAVRVFREGLGGMEQECGCIAGYAGIEAQDRLDPWFLKHAKRTPRKAHAGSRSNVSFVVRVLLMFASRQSRGPSAQSVRATRKARFP